MYLAPASVALVGERGRARYDAIEWRDIGLGLSLYLLFMCLLTGLRFEVGGDWDNYLGYQDAIRNTDFQAVFSRRGDLGYWLLNWLTLDAGWDIFGVNLFCALVFFIGLVALCRESPRPWLATSVAVPYLVVVVAMGYSRQSVALGFAMLGYVALARGKVLSFVVAVLIGATFHKTAIVLLPVAILAAAKNRFWSAVWLGVVAIVGYRVALESNIDKLYTTYVGGEMQSSGALIRLLMNVVPAGLFLAVRKQLRFGEAEEKLWFWIAVISIALLGAFLVRPSASTALDRIALYFLPIQVVVLSRLPDCFVTSTGGRGVGVVGLILGCYAGVLFVWLNYADNAYAWAVYTFYPFAG
jgi:hypothetical protein